MINLSCEMPSANCPSSFVFTRVELQDYSVAISIRVATAEQSKTVKRNTVKLQTGFLRGRLGRNGMDDSWEKNREQCYTETESCV